MSNDAPIQRRPRPPFSEDSDSSPRDQILARVEALLSEPGPPAFPGQQSEEDTGPPDLINLAAIVEVAKLPPSITRPAPPPPGEAPPVDASAPLLLTVPQEEPPARRSSLAGSIFQAFILLFVLTWVFVFGILIGRGHVWESGLGHDVIVWLERELRGESGEPKTAPPPSSSNRTEAPPLPGEYRDYYQSSAPEARDTSEPPPPPRTARSGSGSVGARLAENVVLDWSGRQWFAQETAREREASRTSPTATDDDFEIEVEEPIPSTPGTVAPPPAALPEPVPTTPTATAAIATPAPSAGQSSASASPIPVASASAPASPAPTDAEQPLGRFAVQVFLVYDQAEAQRRVERLEKSGFTAYYYQGAGGRIPVRVGHFTTRQAAEEALARLKSLGYGGAYISTLSD